MICSIVIVAYKYNYCILFKGLPCMYITINYNMYTICIRNMARSKSIPLLCTHIYSYMFSTVHPRRSLVSPHDTWRSSALLLAWVCSMMLWDVRQPMLHNDLQVDESVHKWHLTSLCRILKNKIPLLIELQNRHTSNIPMCNAKCHDINIIPLLKVV